MAVSNQSAYQLLIHALFTIQSESELSSVLQDLLTDAERQEFARRFEIARLLWTTQDSYLEIAAQVKTSTTTVTRVAAWLFKEKWQGYATLLKRLYGEAVRSI